VATWTHGPRRDGITWEASAYRRLAVALSDYAAENDKIINRRTTWGVACGGFLAVQVVLWIANGLAVS
jgi:hypothetical protein